MGQACGLAMNLQEMADECRGVWRAGAVVGRAREARPDLGVGQTGRHQEGGLGVRDE